MIVDFEITIWHWLGVLLSILILWVLTLIINART